MSPVPFWSPPVECTPQEKAILKLCRRTRKLIVFLREHRHEIVDADMHAAIAATYRDTGAGKPPLPPGLLAMASLLQGYMGVSDAEAVQLAVVDRRWQVVLDCWGADKAPFSQGALVGFRRRLVEHDLDRLLLEKTAEVARRCGGFDPKQLPKDLRFAVDSAPLIGAGRVEDTINLLGRAARKLVDCAELLLGRDAVEICTEAGIPVLLAPSIKQGLDRVWTRPGEREAAVTELMEQIESLVAWLTRECSEQVAAPPLSEHLETLRRLVDQDLEPDPEGGGLRVRRGVASDRQVSIEDPDMRHGRKSKSKRFNGYKRHVAAELGLRIIDACAVTPANQPEAVGFDPLKTDLAAAGKRIASLYIDRAYVSSPEVQALASAGVEVVCRPWGSANGALYSKDEFVIDLAAGTAKCPAGQIRPARPGLTVKFDPEHCSACELRPKCTKAADGRGRSLRIAPDEPLQQRLKRAADTREGRDSLRKRVPVEHRLAHVVGKQGRRARYRGLRANLYDLRRTCAILNLETAPRLPGACARPPPLSTSRSGATE